MKLLVEAKYIPDGTIVRKKTGTYNYTIRDNIKIFTYDTANSGKGSNTTRQVIAQEGMKYMLNDSGNINMVSGDTLLCVDLEENNDGMLILSSILEARTGQCVNISFETLQ